MSRPCGYPLKIFPEEVDSKYCCTSCHLILKHPIQNQCGHRFCKDCIEYIISHENVRVCPLCNNEESNFDRTFPDNAINREFYTMRAKCPSEGCVWSGSFKKFEEHFRNCLRSSTQCPICNQTIDPVTEENILNHVEQNLELHLDTALDRLTVLETAVGISASPLNRSTATSPAAFQKSLNETIRCLEQKFDALNEMLKNNQDVSKNENPAASIGTRRPDEERGATGGNPDVMTLQENLIVYENVIAVLNTELARQTKRMTSVAKERPELVKEFVDAMDQKLKLLERTLKVKDVTIAELDLRITELELTSYDGTLLWKITNFSQRRQEAITGNKTSIYSPAFYTNKTGYKMCARLYLNGDGMGKGTHISLFFVIMRGQYDALLRWPFRQKVTLIFLDQNGKEHVTDAFRPDQTSSSFKRPTSEMNIASGCPLFVSLSQLDGPAHAYVKENTAFIKITVSGDD